MDTINVKFGTLVEINQDNEVETVDGDKIQIKKGENAVIGFDGRIHYLSHRLVEDIDPNIVKIDGISSRGLANYISGYLGYNMNLEKLLKDNGMDIDMLSDCIVGALGYIGIEDDTEMYNGE